MFSWSNSQGASLNPNGASNCDLGQPTGGEYSGVTVYTRLLAAVTLPVIR